MHPVPVLVLISVLQFCISFPAVAGDCYDDPLGNNRSYNNCATCYQTLVNALINTGDNKYHLSRVFFPHNAEKPVQVNVTYKPTAILDDDPCNISNSSITWYWLMGEFYVYQPMDIFLYRSLLFSPPYWRKEDLSLELPYQCFCYRDLDRFDKFFKYLTQRLNLHGLYHTDTINYVSEMYMYVGKAVKASEPQYEDDEQIGNDGLRLMKAMYSLPFIVIFILIVLLIAPLIASLAQLIASLIIGKKLCSVQPYGMKIKKKITGSLEIQANLAALTLLCCLFTIFNTALDITSLVKEDYSHLPEYFERRSYGLYYITIVFSSISLLFDVIGIIWFIVVWCHNLCCCYESCKGKWGVYIPMLFCIGSTLLSFSFHFQSILIAWSTDPFYASRIALFYGIVIFFFFIPFKYAYALPLKWRGIEDPSHWGKVEYRNVAISLVVTAVLCSGLLVTHDMFFVIARVNNFIEQSITGISSMYNGAVILIGGFIGYSVAKRYFGKPFSLENALKKAMKQMKSPFNPSDNTTWKTLTEEECMTEVIKALIHHQTLSRPRYSSLYSALISVILRAQRNGELINPPADQVVTLSTVLYDSITTAVRTAAGNNVVNINALTDALVEVMNNPEFVLDGPHIDLAEIPTRRMLNVLRNDVERHIRFNPVDRDGIRMDLTIALFAPLPSALASALRNAQNNGQNINPTGEEVFVLTTALYNDIMPAVQNADEENNTLINALIEILSAITLNDPNINLAQAAAQPNLNDVGQRIVDILTRQANHQQAVIDITTALIAVL